MKRNSKTLRVLSTVAVITLVCLGLALHSGTGTPSAWGIYNISAICPLGALEAIVASKTVVPPLLIAVFIAIVLVVIFGRAFCAWGCPIPLLRRIFGSSSSSEKRPEKITETKKHAREEGILDNKRGGLADSRNWVLGGTLLSTALFGFPVFCLICPVGLTFATIIAFWRLFQFNEVVLSLVIFPVILVFEVVVLRKWCSRFCPLGALFSLIARLNKTWVPRKDEGACLHATKSESCRKCVDVCPEGINLHDKEVSAPMNECTKCRACADVCPMHAITFPFLPKGQPESEPVAEESMQKH